MNQLSQEDLKQILKSQIKDSAETEDTICQNIKAIDDLSGVNIDAVPYIELEEELDNVPILAAAMYNCYFEEVYTERVINALLQQGTCDIYFIDVECRTPIMLAAMNEDWDNLRIMLDQIQSNPELSFSDRKAYINQQDQFGDTIMHVVFEKKELGLIEALLELGGVVTVANSESFTPLYWANEHGRDFCNIIASLLSSGADDSNIDALNPYVLIGDGGDQM